MKIKQIAAALILFPVLLSCREIRYIQVDIQSKGSIWQVRCEQAEFWQDKSGNYWHNLPDYNGSGKVSSTFILPKADRALCRFTTTGRGRIEAQMSIASETDGLPYVQKVESGWIDHSRDTIELRLSLID